MSEMKWPVMCARCKTIYDKSAGPKCKCGSIVCIVPPKSASTTEKQIEWLEAKKTATNDGGNDAEYIEGSAVDPRD